MTALTVLYDDQCALCAGARRWLEQQQALVPLHFVACSSAQAARRYAALPWLGEQLVVVARDGRVWAGPPAFVMCLWALRRYRWLSVRLAAPHAWPLAARLLRGLSSERRRLSGWLQALRDDHPGCTDAGCPHHPAPPRGPYR